MGKFPEEVPIQFEHSGTAREDVVSHIHRPVGATLSDITDGPPSYRDFVNHGTPVYPAPSIIVNGTSKTETDTPVPSYDESMRRAGKEVGDTVLHVGEETGFQFPVVYMADSNYVGIGVVE